MNQNMTEQIDSTTYRSDLANKLITKSSGGGLSVENVNYDKIEMVTTRGVKISFEFPQSVQNENEIVQEVRSILSGELRDSMEKCIG